MQRDKFLPVFLVALVGATAASCGSANSSPDPSACEFGAFYADCGCTGSPVFACAAGDDCRWFVGGCAPEGYVPSTCSSEELCCHSDWPYSRMSDPIAPEAIHSQLYAWGIEPWDAEREMNVSVSVDPTVEASGATVECDGMSPTSGSVCEETTELETQTRSGAVVIYFRSKPELAFAGWDLVLEVSRSRPAQARLCTLAFTDSHSAQCPMSGVEPRCAVSGALELSSDPAAGIDGQLHGRLTSRFDGGGTIELTF